MKEALTKEPSLSHESANPISDPQKSERQRDAPAGSSGLFVAAVTRLEPTRRVDTQKEKSVEKRIRGVSRGGSCCCAQMMEGGTRSLTRWWSSVEGGRKAGSEGGSCRGGVKRRVIVRWRVCSCGREQETMESGQERSVRADPRSNKLTKARGGNFGRRTATTARTTAHA